MPLQDIRIPSLFGGVSRVSQNGRRPDEQEEMVNVELYPDRGVDQRPGTNYIESPDGGSSEGELTVNTPTSTVMTFWINRGDGERFLCMIDPTIDDDDIIQVFNAETGAKMSVVGPDGVTGLGDVGYDALRDYLTAGSGDARRRYSALTIEDSTVILNRTAVTALTGRAITYQNGLTPTEVRNRNNGQNVDSWSDFNHPPSVDSGDPTTIPTGVPGDGNINFADSGLWYARDDDVGFPAGFYMAISATQPPWFQRVRTEASSSLVDAATMPHRLDWDGSKFIFNSIDWTARFSGDSFTNPGPSFIGNPISDITFHQDRLSFGSGENYVTGQLGDLFSLWIDSVVLQVDTDPIDRNIAGNKYSPIDYLISFREAVVCMTSGSRQVEVRANGPITPSTVMLFDSTNIESVNYVRPTVLGSQMYFMGERDFSNTVWEYYYSSGEVSNTANEITNRVRGYIPAQASLITASASQNQLFILTDAQPNYIYVNRMEFVQTQSGLQKTMNAWYHWDFGREIISIAAMDDTLYLLIRNNNLMWLETMPLGFPEQDTDGSPAQTLGYAVRLDRKSKVQGVYDSMTDTTSWTLPFEDSLIDEVVLAATWDTASQKMGGTRLSGLTVNASGGSTVITIDGDYENNADGSNAPAYIGRSFDAYIDLSEQFARAQDGTPIHGNLSLLSGKIRFRDGAAFSVEITPPGRSTLTKEYVNAFIGSTPLDGVQLEEFGEFQFRIMSQAHKCGIRLVNNTPFPAAWIDLDIHTRFNPAANSPLR